MLSWIISTPKIKKFKTIIMIITIDTEDIKKLHLEAENIVLEPQAENVLKQIIELEDMIAAVKETAKKKLEIEAYKLNPHFKSWQSDEVKVTMRAYGAKYFISDVDFKDADKEMFRTEVVVVAPNEDYDVIVKKLNDIGFEVQTMKTDAGMKYKISRTVETKAVDKYEKQYGRMPAGISHVKDRKKSLTIVLRQEEVKEE